MQEDIGTGQELKPLLARETITHITRTYIVEGYNELNVQGRRQQVTTVIL
ncbi:MAG: hypothetical protein ACI90V_004868 [Bacillariaceae sp.]|jgi:hypothetical protein